MNSNFLAENFDNISKSLERTNEEKFVKLASLLMTDSFNKTNNSSELLRDLYKYINDVVNCIDESKIAIENICKVSNVYDQLHRGDNEGDAEYLMWAYIVLVRFLIEYTYRMVDTYLMERMTHAIDDYHGMNVIFKNIQKHGFKFFYLYVKNEYTSKLIQSDFIDVKNKIGKLTSIENKIDLAINKSEEISIKYSKLQHIDNEYFKSFRDKLSEASIELESKIFEKVKIIEDLDKKVNRTNDNLTMKGLSGAYGDLSDIKNKEKRKALFVLILSIIGVLSPLGIRILTIFLGIDYSIYEYILTGTATLIFIYYFRVALINYNSIKTELNQINLRTALCKFIHGYVEFSQRNNNHDSLSKFESLIFSNIVPDDKNIPATLDGLEQLAKLIGALKAK
ncbi:hypothetical protein [Providencia sp. wls1916]|uniref:hypothetical protein n=1 Tax=Providencia sp. wls1916 TaxID=2675155 RepID=UPI0012B57180|nr:hypothetical protein [Providencia sp. wls1916]MTC77729.1 hypothetical protein [Providencia sp. wls1916]